MANENELNDFRRSRSNGFLELSSPSTPKLPEQVLEYNNEEKKARQVGPPLVFDASQKGNWENIRNETMNGKPFRFKSEAFEPPPSVRITYIYYV